MHPPRSNGLYHMQRDARSVRSFRQKQSALVLSLDSIEIEPTQLSYPTTPIEHPQLLEKKREEKLADMVQLIRRSPAPKLFTGSPKAPLTSRSSKTCFFSEATDDTDEIVTPRAPPASLLLPPSVRSSRQSHHKSCFSFPVQQWERYRPPPLQSSLLHLEATLRAHRNTVTSALFLPAGLVSSSSDYSLKLWELCGDRRSLRTACVYSVNAHKGKVVGLSSVSEDVVCSAGQDATCCLWAVRPLKIKKAGKVRLARTATSMLCPSPLTLLTGAPDGKIYVNSLEATTGSESAYSGHEGTVTDLISIGATTFLSAGFDATVRLWDYRTRASITVLKEHRDTVNRLMQWDEYAFLSVSSDHQLKVSAKQKWDSRTCTVVQTLTSNSPILDVVRVRQRLVTSGRRISVWSGQEATTWSPHDAGITRLAYSHERDLLIACSCDCTLSVSNMQVLRPHF